ncbi:proline-rich protein 22 [Octodon degus]|uniref:Proline-rich protein 22 n=1 Tax=Octodon degus TaxID=10160 RepID=A0A6P6EK41_OCTDE|nr:proline-rich protein 22 [Octodon degus]
MEHPKPFSMPAASQDGFSPQGLGNNVGAGGCPVLTGTDTLPTMASANLLYQPPTLEKDVFPVPPAGFQMAPCGCFFDPRIYRIEWATTDFGQALYKLAVAKGPASPGNYLLEPQCYAKAPVPPPYPHYQPAGPPYLMPYFPPERPSHEALGFVGGRGPPGFVELPSLLLKGGRAPLPPAKDTTVPPLLVSLPAEAPLAPGTFSQPQGHQGQVPGPEGLGEPAEPLVFSTKALQGCSEAGLHLSQPPPPAPCEPKALEATLSGTGRTEPRAGVTPVCKVPGPRLLCLPSSGQCPPSGPHTPNSGPHPPNTGQCPPKSKQCPPKSGPRLPSSRHRPPKSHGGQDTSVSDIHSLHLPEELLSFDYSVPEILDTVSNVDYLFNFKALDEEPQACPATSGADPVAPVPQADTRRKKRAPSSARKGKAGGKGKQAATGARQDLDSAPH